jgi:hypothetical protein
MIFQIDFLRPTTPPVAASAERLDARLDHIGKMSRDNARDAHKEILEAIERLQTFEKLLARKVDAS